jgi:putative transposase
MSIPLASSLDEQPKKLFEMIRMDIRESVGQYLSKLMEMELSHFFGREPFERRKQEDLNQGPN